MARTYEGDSNMQNEAQQNLSANKPAQRKARFRWKPEPWQLELKRRWYRSRSHEVRVAANIWRYLCTLHQRLSEEKHPQTNELMVRVNQCAVLCYELEARAGEDPKPSARCPMCNLDHAKLPPNVVCMSSGYQWLKEV
jgi:hypothetical protein